MTDSPEDESAVESHPLQGGYLALGYGRQYGLMVHLHNVCASRHCEFADGGDGGEARSTALAIASSLPLNLTGLFMAAT
jgi:hypothetical protein